MNFLKLTQKYIGLIVALVITFICFKLINNFSYFLGLFKSIISIISPFIYAFIIAYLLNPIVKLFHKKLNLRYSLSILLTYASIILLCILSSLYFVPKIVSSLYEFYANLPYAFDQIEKLISSIQNNAAFQHNILLNSIVHSDFSSLIDSLKETLASVSNFVLKHTISTTLTIGKFILGFLISIYVLIYKEAIKDFFKKLTYLIFRKHLGNKILNFCETLDSMLVLYIIVKGFTSLIIGGLAFVGLTILGSPYTLLISIFITITNMIPYFGPFLGMILAFIINIIFMPSKAIIVFIFIFILQQFDAWYLYPKTVGTRVGLNPIVVILSVLVGGELYGPIGMVLSVPIVASFMVYFNKYFNDAITETAKNEEIDNL